MVDQPKNDPHRLVAAAHELGHAIAWRASGLDIAEIWIKGRGTATHGHVWLVQTDTEIRTLDDELAVQAGLLAGRIAQELWCDRTNVAIPFSCADDETLYRARRRTPLGHQVSRTAARTAARSLVRARWSAITRLAPVLARAGRLSPDRLPTCSTPG